MRFRVLTILITACLSAEGQRPSSAGGSPEHHADVEITWHILKPVELPAPDVSQLHVPPGFRLQKFAENLGNARMLAIGPNGNVYVTRREESDVLMFRVGSDGLAKGQPVRVASRPGLHGIAFSKGKVYLAAVHEIFKADVRPDGTFGPLDMIIHDLPDAGQHNTRTVQIGPDDMMYISIGSTCNECAASPIRRTPLSYAPPSTASPGRFSPRAYGTPSDGGGIPRPASCGEWIKALTPWVITSNRRS